MRHGVVELVRCDLDAFTERGYNPPRHKATRNIEGEQLENVKESQGGVIGQHDLPVCFQMERESMMVAVAHFVEMEVLP